MLIFMLLSLTNLLTNLKEWNILLFSATLVYSVSNTQASITRRNSQESVLRFSGPNIAIGKQASQQPGVWEGGKAELAIDNNLTNDVIACAHTNYSSNKPAYWEVKLGQPYRISGIEIYNRKEKSTRLRLKHFKILGDGGDVLYQNQQQTSACSVENRAHEGTSICDDIIKIPIENATSYSSIRISVDPHSNNYYGDNGRALLCLCEVQVYAYVCPPAIVEHGNVTQSAISRSGDNINVTCNVGYETVQPSSTCQDSRLWEPLPKCDVVQCLSPKPPSNGHYNYTQYSSLPYGSMIYFTCNYGYELVNLNSNRECLQHRIWSGEEPVCEIVNCSYPESVSNGTYVDTLTDKEYTTGSKHFMSIITVKCNIGFLLEHPVNRTCLATKLWSDKTPTCSLVYCDVPDPIVNGTYLLVGKNIKTFPDNKLPYNTMLTATCYLGYRLHTRQVNRTCQNDRTWSGQTPTCEPVMCQVSKPPVGLYYINSGNESNGQVPYQTTIELKCETNFRFNGGNLTRQCKADGHWDGTEPICAATCNVTSVEHGTIQTNCSATESTYIEGETLHISCDKGHNPPDKRITCQANHQWSSEPTCQDTSKLQFGIPVIIGCSIGAMVVAFILGVIAGYHVYKRRMKSTEQKINEDNTYASISMKRPTEHNYTDISQQRDTNQDRGHVRGESDFNL